MMFQLRVEEQESLSNEPQAECRFSLVLSRLMHMLTGELVMQVRGSLAAVPG